MAFMKRGHSAQQRGGSRRARGRYGRNARNIFRSSRLQEVEDDKEPSQEEISLSNDDPSPNGSADELSEAESEQAVTNSYSSLLSALRVHANDEHRATKRRRITTENGTSKIEGDQKTPYTEQKLSTGEADEAQADANLTEFEEEENAEELVGIGSDDGEEESLSKDPFQKHFALGGGTNLTDTTKMKSPSSTLDGPPVIKKSLVLPDGASSSHSKSPNDIYLKSRLQKAGSHVVTDWSSSDRDMGNAMFNYLDIVNGCRTVQNVNQYRRMSCLHALNHIFKTRDRVLKNNNRLSQQDDSENLDLRDQGFTRPKVLFILPTKQACVKYIDCIVELSEPEQQENKSRLVETFSQEDDEAWEEKTEDFRELFGGNHDEDFRIGLKFTRKTIKYFSGFYNSDIIIGSPLGLMRTITTGGGKKDQNKIHDADFLSSIEVVIMDNTSALQMSNWQHIEYVFSQLNLLPKESHGCDFSRVRNWYLDGNAKQFRQTIIFSAYLTPEINSLVSTNLHNRAGRVKYQSTYKGAMLDVASIVHFTVTQTFVRFDAPSPAADHDARFKHFTNTILPGLIRDSKSSSSGSAGGSGTLLFVPTYLDFVRLRNHFSTAIETVSLSFGSISEYTPVRDVARARSHFSSGRHGVLLYTERAHHHFRYKVRGVRKIVFYGVPENPIFWAEMVGLLGYGSNDGNVGDRVRSNQGRGLVRALFSKWDAMKLERVVGSERVARLVGDKAGDTFEFV